MTDYTLPLPLPPPDLGSVLLGNGTEQRLGHSDESMLAYGRACAKAAIERCALVCEQLEEQHLQSGHYLEGAEHCAAAIRERYDSMTASERSGYVLHKLTE